MKSFKKFSKEMKAAMRGNDAAEVQKLALEGARNYNCPESLYLLGVSVAKKYPRAVTVLFERALELKQKVPLFHITVGISWLNLDPQRGYALLDVDSHLMVTTLFSRKVTT